MQIITKKPNGVGKGVIDMTLGRINWSHHTLHSRITDEWVMVKLIYTTRSHCQGTTCNLATDHQHQYEARAQ